MHRGGAEAPPSPSLAPTTVLGVKGGSRLPSCLWRRALTFGPLTQARQSRVLAQAAQPGA